MRNGYARVEYLTVDGVKIIHGKIWQIDRGHGLVDIHIFPFYNHGTWRSFRSSLIIENLWENTFIVVNFKTLNALEIDHSKTK